MQFLRQSTASQEISLGQFLDSTDGDTEEGGLTIANTDIKIRKHGGTTLINKISGGATVISNGVYQCALDATDTNTAGMLEVYVHVAGALAVKSTYTVLTATAFDSLFTGTFNNLGGTAQTSDHTANISTILGNTLTNGYHGPEGFGIYIDDGAANTNTVDGVDGIFSNPVSTFTAARTLADSLGIEVYYLINNTNLTLAATHVDWEFVGFGSMTDNTINLGSQDVSRSRFLNLVIEGTQGGSSRIEAERCALQDPGAGTTTLHLFAIDCGIVDDVTIDTSNDNAFIDSFSLVAGTSAPIVRGSGASGTLQMRGHRGGVDLRNLSASHSVSLEQVGQVIFDSSNNVNATIALRGIGTITDNTAGMSNLNQDAYLNMLKINAECDTAISDAAPTNWGSMVISGAGAVDSLTQGFLNNLITETTPSNFATNISTFYDNADALTAKVVDNVGAGGGGGLTAQQTADAVHNLTPVGTVQADSIGANQASIETKIDTVDGVVDAILIDTNDLQINQGDWLTATGFNVGKTGYTLTTQDWNTVAPDNAGITANGVAIAALNNITAADVWTSGTRTVTAFSFSVDIQSINGVTIIGDGSGTPFDV